MRPLVAFIAAAIGLALAGVLVLAVVAITRASVPSAASTPSSSASGSIEHCLTKNGRSLEFEDYLMTVLEAQVRVLMREEHMDLGYAPGIRLEFDTHTVRRVNGRYLYRAAYDVIYVWSSTNTMTQTIRPQAWIAPATCWAVPVLER